MVSVKRSKSKIANYWEKMHFLWAGFTGASGIFLCVIIKDLPNKHFIYIPFVVLAVILAAVINSRIRKARTEHWKEGEDYNYTDIISDVEKFLGDSEYKTLFIEKTDEVKTGIRRS